MANVRVSVVTLASACSILTWPVARAASPPAVPGWADQVLYFAIVDRFADGDAGNNVNVDRTARGAFHGGDLKGLRAHLSEIADLGVTALWITPVVKNIDGFVTGAGVS
ncbi:MAG: alpha-amylase family glycosyl hydrolase [Vicinamibacterales bacterium]